MIETLEKYGRELLERATPIDVETDSNGYIICSEYRNRFICSGCSKKMRFRNVAYVDVSHQGTKLWCHECLLDTSSNLGRETTEGDSASE